MEDHNDRHVEMRELAAAEIVQIHGGTAVDYFINVDGVDGDSTGYQRGYVGWLKVPDGG